MNDVASTDVSPTLRAFVSVVAIAQSSATRTDACSLGFILGTSRNGEAVLQRRTKQRSPAPARPRRKRTCSMPLTSRGSASAGNTRNSAAHGSTTGRITGHASRAGVTDLSIICHFSSPSSSSFMYASAPPRREPAAPAPRPCPLPAARALTMTRPCHRPAYGTHVASLSSPMLSAP